jgi:hypothetical protein
VRQNEILSRPLGRLFYYPKDGGFSKTSVFEKSSVQTFYFTGEDYEEDVQSIFTVPFIFRRRS